MARIRKATNRSTVSRRGSSPIGRKPKLTDEAAKAILDAISMGATHTTACRAARIGKSTFYSWLKKGEDEASGLFRDFLDAVRQVEAQRECEALAHISEAAHHDWRAAAWYLARRYPERWGNRRRLAGKRTDLPIHMPIRLTAEDVALGKVMADALEHFAT
jgi:hypothetical protein